MSNDYDDSDSTNAEIEDQLRWHQEVMYRVLHETGCLLNDQALVLIIKEFGKRVEKLRIIQKKNS